jgi:hypothetical protein
MAEACIVAAARTAGGKRNGKLSGWRPADLAASVLGALIARTGCDPALVEDVIMGCVGQAGEQALCFAPRSGTFWGVARSRSKSSQPLSASTRATARRKGRGGAGPPARATP